MDLGLLYHVENLKTVLKAALRIVTYATVLLKNHEYCSPRESRCMQFFFYNDYIDFRNSMTEIRTRRQAKQKVSIFSALSNLINVADKISSVRVYRLQIYLDYVLNVSFPSTS